MTFYRVDTCKEKGGMWIPDETTHSTLESAQEQVNYHKAYEIYAIRILEIREVLICARSVNYTSEENPE